MSKAENSLIVIEVKPEDYADLMYRLKLLKEDNLLHSFQPVDKSYLLPINKYALGVIMITSIFTSMIILNLLNAMSAG